MNKDMKIDSLKAMLTKDRVIDLLDLLEGDSEFSTDSGLNIPNSEEKMVARSLALDHVRFVAKYGSEQNRVVEGEKVFSSRLKEFNDWLSLGAPGIEDDELEAYLRAHPIR